MKLPLLKKIASHLDWNNIDQQGGAGGYIFTGFQFLAAV
jgi:hypothetical protein